MKRWFKEFWDEQGKELLSDFFRALADAIRKK
jgi:hypothetical protein